MRICSKDVTVPSIPLFSAEAANANIDLLSPVKRVLNRHWYILGEEVVSFEREFAQYLSVENCVTVANGTDALELGSLFQGHNTFFINCPCMRGRKKRNCGVRS